jgi:GMP synthase (glutamine-hydrolysing)
MAKIAYLDNGPRPDETSRLPERLSSMGVDVDRFWAFKDEYPDRPEDYAGVLLSGSPLSAYDDLPFIHRQHHFIRELAHKSIPALGLCFGSQILASALCGRDQVFRRKSCEVGYADLALTPAAAEDVLMRGAGSPVDMFVWHNDEVRSAHPDMNILAHSIDCPNHIWRYRDHPIWGIQGHPEVTRENAGPWFERSREALSKDGADVNKLIAEARDSIGGLSMLANFVEVCRQPK